MRFLRDMWLIMKATLCHPFSSVDVDLDTGRIKKVEDPDWGVDDDIVISSKALRLTDKVMSSTHDWLEARAAKFARERGETARCGKILIDVSDVNNAATELLFLINEGNLS